MEWGSGVRAGQGQIMKGPVDPAEEFGFCSLGSGELVAGFNQGSQCDQKFILKKELWAEWNGRGRIRVLVLNLGCTLNPLGNFKNTDAWASPSESVIVDLGCGLALGLFYKASHMILMYIQCRQPLD